MNASGGQRPFYLGVDVGGTNIKVGIVDGQARTLAKVSVPTEAAKGPKVGLETICRACTETLKQGSMALGDIRAIGLATPGTMDIPTGMLLDPPNLPGWTNEIGRAAWRERV